MLPENSPPQLRRATADDAPFIRAMTARFLASGSPPWRDQARIVIFQERGIGEIAAVVAAGAVPRQEAILIATDAEGTRLGFIHLRPETSGLTLERQGYVNALAVTAAAEGRGVGRALLAAGEAWARDQGFRFLTLEAFGDNRRARDFYARLGFAEETVRLAKPL